MSTTVSKLPGGSSRWPSTRSVPAPTGAADDVGGCTVAADGPVMVAGRAPLAEALPSRSAAASLSSLTAVEAMPPLTSSAAGRVAEHSATASVTTYRTGGCGVCPRIASACDALHPTQRRVWQMQCGTGNQMLRVGFPALFGTSA